MPRRGENIYKRKDGRWEGRYIKERDLAGKAKYGYVYAKSYKSIKDKLKTKIVSSFIDTGKTKSEKYTDILTSWLQYKRITVKESTYTKYKYIVDSYISPRIGNLSVYLVDSECIGRFLDELLHFGKKDGKSGLAPKTVSNILLVIKESLEYAKNNGYVVSNNLKKLTVKKKEKEMRVLTVDEQALLTRYLQKDINLYKLGVLLSLYTGIRIGELCALRWENIDLRAKKICIRETLQRIQTVGKSSKTCIIITEPKSTCSLRDIPIPECLMQIITKFAATPKAYLLTGEKNRYAEPRTMQYHFKQYIEKAGIAPANYHSLRHTFATRCVEADFEIKSLSEVIGHANVNITLNRYVHSSFELKAINMNKLSL